ncbi:hypothetical protein [Aeromonas salmonicida]|uniref:hypothetical protein n=1 Tax=Aeromonas salmonicida TaxID=645 RepID=UPI003D31685F
MKTEIEKRGTIIDVFAVIEGKKKFIGNVYELTDKYSDGFNNHATMHGAVDAVIKAYKKVNK